MDTQTVHPPSLFFYPAYFPLIARSNFMGQNALRETNPFKAMCTTLTFTRQLFTKDFLEILRRLFEQFLQARRPILNELSKHITTAAALDEF